MLYRCPYHAGDDSHTISARTGPPAVGEIVEVGDGVVSRKIGDRVGLPWGCELLADIASGACAAKANFAGIL